MENDNDCSLYAPTPLADDRFENVVWPAHDWLHKNSYALENVQRCESSYSTRNRCVVQHM